MKKIDLFGQGCPERMDDYTLGRTLGEGTFGKVKAGVHKLTGAKVCMI